MANGLLVPLSVPLDPGSSAYQHQVGRGRSEEVELTTVFLNNHRSLYGTVRIEKVAATIGIDLVLRGKRTGSYRAVGVYSEPKIVVSSVPVKFQQGEV